MLSFWLSSLQGCSTVAATRVGEARVRFCHSSCRGGPVGQMGRGRAWKRRREAARGPRIYVLRYCTACFRIWQIASCMLWLWPKRWPYVVIVVMYGRCGLRGFAAMDRFVTRGRCGRLKGTRHHCPVVREARTGWGWIIGMLSKLQFLGLDDGL